MAFLPTNKQELLALGIDQPDFVIVSGDAYIDHPSFGVAIISRVLERFGYSVCIVSQPDYKSTKELKDIGKPRLAYLVTSGNIDSMVNHYSVSKKRRDKDNYTDNGEMGKRPDRATIVYSQMCKRAYKDVPVILGGIEASLRRLAHYDYWDDKVRHSLIIDSQADLLVYGMAENTIVEVAEALNSGLDIKDIIYIRGTVWKTKNEEYVKDFFHLPSYDEIVDDKEKYAKSTMIKYQNNDAITAKTLVEEYKDFIVVQNPPALPLTQEEMDFTYSLPYERTFHPKYKYVPAIEEVRFSIISNRGCFGSCAFCALTAHQGRVISTRSHESIMEEAKKITEHPEFKGYIHDVGGPTANFHRTACDKQIEHGACVNRECLHPKPCNNLEVDHSKYLKLLRELRELPKVKKVFIRSGIRYDYLMYDKNDEFFNELVQHHISGQLKVAPEHINDRVLDKMGKPNRHLYEKFVDKYERLNAKYGKNQFLVPYLMSSHPGSDINAAIELAQYLKKINHTPQQVQDFYPTPSTLATCMYYTGIDPKTMKKVYVAKTPKEKAMQRALIQFKYPQNYELVYEALKSANRLDLVGFGTNCLIKPKGNSNFSRNNNGTKANTNSRSNSNDNSRVNNFSKNSSNDSVRGKSNSGSNSFNSTRTNGGYKKNSNNNFKKNSKSY